MMISQQINSISHYQSETDTSMASSTQPYDVVRSTCLAFQSDCVSVDKDAAQAFANELDVPAVKAFGVNLAFDANFTGTKCKFESVDHEAAFILLFHALDFGSGWRLALHKHHGKGAFLTIKPGVENFFMAHPNLTSQELMEADKTEVAKAFGIDNNEELQDLVDKIHQVIVECGTQTQQEYGSLTKYMQVQLAKTCASKTPAGDLVWDLVKTFPATFDDCYTVNNQKVALYKKAQLVVGEMYHRFRNEDERFNFADGLQLTAYIDNVICASLRYKKIVVPCDEMTAMIEHHQDIDMGSEEEVAFRAAALVGIETVVNMLREQKKQDLSSNELGNYLWAGLGKEPEVRKFNRHATKTLFY